MWPAVSATSSEEVFNADFRTGAVDSGAVILQNLGFEAPWDAIMKLQDLLATRPDLVERFNAPQPKDKPNFKAAALDPLRTNPAKLIDQKVSVDMSAKRLQALAESGEDLHDLLGDSSYSVVEFYKRVEEGLVPRIMQALSGLIDGDLDPIHTDRAYTLRLSSYFTRQAGLQAPRCGEHRDFGTFTVLFQDPVQPGLEILKDGIWTRVPAGCCLVTFGWCAQIRSNDRVEALPHRVQDSPAGADGMVPRRDAAIFFVAPDVAAPLKCIARQGEVPQYAGMPPTHHGFKILMARRWSEREGTVEAGPDTRTQEEIVEDYRRTATAKNAAGSATKEALGFAAVPAPCA